MRGHDRRSLAELQTVLAALTGCRRPQGMALVTALAVAALAPAGCTVDGWGDGGESWVVQGPNAGGNEGLAEPGAGEEVPLGTQAHAGVDTTIESPTGTTLLPALSGPGYRVVDEICGAPQEDGYAARFHTAMFRDLTVHGARGYAVDGSHLWVFDLTDPTSPQRLSLQALQGHPVASHVAAGRLWVASVDAGLVGYALGEDGLVDVNEGDAVRVPVGTRTMDVTGWGQTLFVAAGDKGLAVVSLGPGPELTRRPRVQWLPAAPYAASVTLSPRGDELNVAACERVWSYALLPHGGVSLRGTFPVPFGAAKQVTTDGGRLFVSAGQGLQIFRLVDEEARYLGYYAEDLPGFYVNQAAVQGQTLYLAAGDESVRALNADELPLDQGAPVTWTKPGDTLDQAMAVDLDEVTTQAVPRDPVALALADGYLYALGNFRYLGERRVEVFDVHTEGWMQPAGRYVQPNDGVALSPLGTDLLVHRADGRQQLVRAGAPPTVAGDFDFPAPLTGTANAGAALYLYGPDALARVTPNAPSAPSAPLGIEVQALPTPATGLEPTSVAVAADGTVWVSDDVSQGLAGLDPTDGTILWATSADDGFLGDAALLDMGAQLLAYDRVLGEVRVFDHASADVAAGAPLLTQRARFPVGLCEAYEASDFYSGADRVRARLLAGDGGVALLCPRTPQGDAALLWLDLDQRAVGQRVLLPTARFTSATLQGDDLLVTAFDNPSYRSTVAILDSHTGDTRATAAFTGRANDLCELRGLGALRGLGEEGKRVFVVDGDAGLRVFDAALRPALPAPLTY